MAKHQRHLEALQMANVQRTRATKDMLFGKARREGTYEVEFTHEDGVTELISIALRAVGLKRYDQLLTENPPTTAQKREGAAYNLDTFAPALLAETMVEPQMSVEDARALWHSEEWNRGELFGLFTRAVDLCNSAVALDPTGSASA